MNYFCPHCVLAVPSDDVRTEGPMVTHVTCGNYVEIATGNEPEDQQKLIDKQLRSIISNMEDALIGTRPKEGEKVATKELSAYLRAIVLGEQDEKSPVLALKEILAEYKFDLSTQILSVQVKDIMTKNIVTVSQLIQRLEQLAVLLKQYGATKTERFAPTTYPKCKTCNVELEPFDSIHYFCPCCRTQLPKGLA
jgi:hypothetical protein